MVNYHGNEADDGSDPPAASPMELEELDRKPKRPNGDNLDPRIISYLANTFSDKTFFGVWDLRAMMKDIKLILQTGQHTCLYIAAKIASGNRTQIKTGFCADPETNIEQLNSRKRKSPSSTPVTKSANAEDSRWHMLAFFVARLEDFQNGELEDIHKQCKSTRGLPERIIKLIDFGFCNNLVIRVNGDIIRRGSRWHLPDVQRYLNSDAHFIEFIRRTYEARLQSQIEVRETEMSDTESSDGADSEFME